MIDVDTKIWMAIKPRIQQLNADLGILIAWPAARTELPTSGGKTSPYIRVGRVTAAPVRRYIADGQQYQRTGFIMLTLVAPLGNDVTYYTKIAGDIADHFSDDVKMPYRDLCVSIPTAPHVQDGFEDGGYWNIPIRVSWRCFA